MFRKRILSALIAGVVAVSALALRPIRTDAADYVQNKSRVSVHDPSVFKDPASGTYYVFGSHIDAAKSKDLQSWSTFTNGYATSNNKLFGSLSSNLAGAFAWAGENLEDCAGGFSVWAPDVIYNPDYVNTDGSKGAYLMYFCTSSTYMRSVIAYAASKTVEGPYTFVDTLIYSGFTSNDSYATSSTKNVNRKYTSTNIDELISAGQVTYNDSWFSSSNFNNRMFPNAIDPTIYYDTDGTMYMCYGSWSGGIFTLEIDPKTGKCIHPKTGTTSDGRMVDSYFGTKISGGYGKSGEGPFVEYNADTGYYYLWVTYGGLLSEGGYNMRVFRSKSATGPFVDAAGNSAVLGSSTNLDSVGLKVMGNYKFSSLSTAYMACGHNSVLRDDDGSWYLFNHARFNDGSEYHEVRVHQMFFNADGWPVTTPYENSGDLLPEGGYEPASLAGTYEFINHGNDTGKTIYTAASISLKADGSVSGAASGTWTQAEDSAMATLVLGGKTYRGYFFAQYDESKTGKRVMTFTAVGTNNQTIWGAQTAAWNGSERSALQDYTSDTSKLVYAPDSVAASDGGLTLCDTALLSDVPYLITNKFSGKSLDLADGKTADGTNVQQWATTGGSQQEWRLTDCGDGYCKISSMADESKCLAVASSSAEDGVNVELQTYTGTANQQWKLQADGGYYGIVSRCSSDTAGLDVYDWSEENGGNINQWNFWGGDCQLWSIQPTHAQVTAGSYAIRNVNSARWVSANGSNVEQGAQTIWSIHTLSDGTYAFTNESGQAITAEGTEEGANLSLSAYTESTLQKFHLWCNKDGSYSLLSAASNNELSFDVYELSTEAGANLCVWSFWGGTGQKFILQPAQTASVDVRKGDLNFDGTVNAVDYALLKRGIFYGFSDSKVKTAADLDSNGAVNAQDAEQFLDFLLHRSTSF